MKSFRVLSTFAAALMLTANLAGAQSADGTDRKDFQLFKDVATSVERYTRFTVFDDVSASVKDGAVTLSGKVTMPYKASDIEKRVARLDGVTQVINKLEVLPVSMFDNQLRARLARAIYSNSALSNYGLGPNPSIHIIVDRGHVTLDGVVMNNMDRQIARSIVGSFSTFGIKNELKTDEEVKQDLEKL